MLVFLLAATRSQISSIEMKAKSSNPGLSFVHHFILWVTGCEPGSPSTTSNKLVFKATLKTLLNEGGFIFCVWCYSTNRKFGPTGVINDSRTLKDEEDRSTEKKTDN